MHDFPNFGFPVPPRGPMIPPTLPLQFHSNRKSAVFTLKRCLSLLQTTIYPITPLTLTLANHFTLFPKRAICRSDTHLSWRTTFECTLCGICAGRARSSICRQPRTDTDKWHTTCFLQKSLPNFAR